MSFAIRPQAVLCGALLLTLSVPAFAAEPAKQLVFMEGVQDTGQFLPNSEVLATIGDRRVRVIDYRVGYFGLCGQNRPGTDKSWTQRVLDEWAYFVAHAKRQPPG